MTKQRGRFEWLLEYRDLVDEISWSKWEIRKVKSHIERESTGDLSRVAHNQGSKSSKLEESLIYWQQQLESQEQLKHDLLKMIDDFNGYEARILRLKYIDGLTLEEIADKLGYSVETIRQKHAELHRRLDFLDTINQVPLELGNRFDYHTLKDHEAEHLGDSFYK
jgi:RNA polymerase sigma factor (sigma-70 family)